ncbi:MAG TPA: hypothetical protein VHY91_02380 [Pirellulales bacterium]|jgi:hypothetical protein|nr:hypothetical protein [Pirellulales bacterium]
MTFQQPWIHARWLLDEKTAREGWYSPSLGIAAWRSSKAVKYYDDRRDGYYSFNNAEQILYHLPQPQDLPVRPENMCLAIIALFQQEQTIDKPLESLKSLELGLEKMTLLDQEMKKVTEGGREWLDYRLRVRHSESTDPVWLFFRADATTKLPELWRIERSPTGNASSDETRFDYPENGPADIYDLGVPKTAKLVDRVPTGDLKRILDALKASRERMDDYRAVFVNLSEPGDDGWWNTRPMVQYRRGDKFRADYSVGWSGDRAAQYKSPGKIDDRGRFWRERVKSFYFCPQYVLRGSTQYTSKTDLVTDADGSEHAEIVLVNRYETHMKPGEGFPPEYSMRPEFACRPPMGIGNPHQEPTLDLHPSEGPPGCILLKVRHTSQEGRMNEKGGGLADENRYWLDPERDYIVTRKDMVMRDDAGNEQLHASDTTEEVARSPRGVWYATKIRRHSPPCDKVNGRRIDQVYHLYVDFDVDLPEAFFDPPKVGRIY